MPHRAAIYTVRVHKRNRPKDGRPLGDIDGSGTYLADRVQDYFRSSFMHVDKEHGREIACAASAHTGHEVRAMFRVGESGFVADIHDRRGAHRLRQEATDTQFVNCATLFRLDPMQELGWWAVHVNHGRSAKKLIQDELRARFHVQHEDLVLTVAPSVSADVLRRAIDQGRLDAIALTRWEKPSDRAAKSTGDWIRVSEGAKLELRLTGDRGHWLKTKLVKRYLDGDTSAFDDIVTFDNIRFDEAKVAVELGDGRQRTFNIESPESGHAFSRDLHDGDLHFVDGEPTPDSLFVQLGDVLNDLT